MDIGYINQDDSLDSLQVPMDLVFQEYSEVLIPRKSEVFKQCLASLSPGDTLHISTLDMIGKNFTDLENVVNNLIAQGVSLKFRKEQMEFSQRDENLAGQIALNFLRQAANFEKRSADKVLKVLKRQGRPGPKVKVSNKLLDQVIDDICEGKTKASIAQELNISRPTLNKLIKKREQELKLLSNCIL